MMRQLQEFQPCPVRTLREVDPPGNRTDNWESVIDLWDLDLTKPEDLLVSFTELKELTVCGMDDD